MGTWNESGWSGMETGNVSGWNGMETGNVSGWNGMETGSIWSGTGLFFWNSMETFEKSDPHYIIHDSHVTYSTKEYTCIKKFF